MWGGRLCEIGLEILKERMRSVLFKNFLKAHLPHQPFSFKLLKTFYKNILSFLEASTAGKFFKSKNKSDQKSISRNGAMGR